MRGAEVRQEILRRRTQQGVIRRLPSASPERSQGSPARNHTNSTALSSGKHFHRLRVRPTRFSKISSKHTRQIHPPRSLRSLRYFLNGIVVHCNSLQLIRSIICGSSLVSRVASQSGTKPSPTCRPPSRLLQHNTGTHRLVRSLSRPDTRLSLLRACRTASDVSVALRSDVRFALFMRVQCRRERTSTVHPSGFSKLQNLDGARPTVLHPLSDLDFPGSALVSSRRNARGWRTPPWTTSNLPPFP